MRVAIVVLLLLLAGCSAPGNDVPQPSDSGSSTTSTPANTAPSTTSTTSTNGTTTPDNPPEPKTWEISIAGNKFVNGSLTIRVGDTVTWTHNDGTTPHTVTADDGEFDSGSCPGAQCMTSLANNEFSFTFTAAGVFPYHCEVHPAMTGTILAE